MTLCNASITSIDWGKFITSNWKTKEDWLSMINLTKPWRISILLNISSISSRLPANKLKKQMRIFWILKNTVIFCCMVKTKQPSVMSLFGQPSYPKRIKLNPQFDSMNSENWWDTKNTWRNYLMSIKSWLSSTKNNFQSKAHAWNTLKTILWSFQSTSSSKDSTLWVWDLKKIKMIMLINWIIACVLFPVPPRPSWNALFLLKTNLIQSTCQNNSLNYTYQLIGLTFH